jgi:rRNA maturation endonuclease Nob1
MKLQENIQRIKEVMNLKDELEEKESGEKWIKCINCKKKFTQTIHKGKKSLPICPYCGTHNDMMEESTPI